MRSEAVKKTPRWGVFRPTGGALQRAAAISRSEMESRHPLHSNYGCSQLKAASFVLVAIWSDGTRTDEGPSARKTTQCVVFSEDGQALDCPRAYFQNYFPNARSAVGDKNKHCSFTLKMIQKPLRFLYHRIRLQLQITPKSAPWEPRPQTAAVFRQVHPREHYS